MYCSKCGRELFDEAVICPYCGCPTQNYNNNTVTFEDKSNIWLCLLSVLFPIVGIILGVVFMSKGMKQSGKTYILCGVGAWAFALLGGMLLGIFAHML